MTHAGPILLGRRGGTQRPASPRARILVHGAERSGPPIHVLRLLEHWAGTPSTVRIDVVIGRPGPLVDQYRAVAPTRVARLDRRSPEQLVQRALSACGLPATGRQVLGTATRVRTRLPPADVTVVNGATAATTQLLRSLPRRGRVSMIAHELSTGWMSNISAEDQDFLLGTVGRYAAVSNSVADYLRTLGVDEHDIEIIPPAVPVRNVRQPRDPSSTLVIGGGGVTDWRKAPDLWLAMAARVLRTSRRSVRFVWFGGDRPGDASGWPLRHEIGHLGLSDHVTFLGEVADTDDVLSEVDVFVSTAREDAAPLVCAEAAMNGTPIVTFANGGAAELVRDGGCGTVVPYPEIDHLAEAVLALVHDDDERYERGLRGHEHVRRHQATATVAASTSEWLLQTVLGTTP